MNVLDTRLGHELAERLLYKLSKEKKQKVWVNLIHIEILLNMMPKNYINMENQCVVMDANYI